VLEAMGRSASAAETAKYASTGVDYAEVFDTLAGLMPRFIGAWEAVAASNSDSTEALVEVCREGVRVRDLLQAVAPRRPWVLAALKARTASAGVVQVMRGFVRAFGARTMLEAQELASAAQQALDDLSPVMEEVADVLGRWAAVADSNDVTRLLTAMAADTFSTAAAADIVGLDTEGREAYRDITGRVSGVGTGPLLLMQRLWVKAMGDEAQFQEALAAADLVLQRHAAGFARALEDPTVVSELRNGWNLLADQLVASNAAIAAAANDRQTVRAVLSLVHTLFEGPGRRFAGLFLDLLGKGKFETHLSADGAGVIHMADQDRHLRTLFYGLHKPLRIAYAHQSFNMVDDLLMLRDRSGQETNVSADELLDHLLAAQECLAAVGVALHVAASENGVELTAMDYLSALGLAPGDVLAACLHLSGAVAVNVDLQGSVAKVACTAPALALGQVGLMCALLADCQVVQVHLTRPAGAPDQVWMLDLAAFHRHAPLPEGIEKEIRFVDAISRAVLNGAPAMSTDAVRHWVAVRAMQVCPDGYPSALPALRSLMDFARARGDDPMATALRDVMRYVRLCGTGAAGEADTRAVDGLMAFVLPSPPELPFTASSGDVAAA